MIPAEPVDVLIRRVLPAPPDVVYDQWLDPDALRDWMCPRPARATRIQLDPRVGGRLRIDIEERGAEFFVTGQFLELDRPLRLVLSWSCSLWKDPSLETIVTVTLEPHGDAETDMTIRHQSLPGTLRADHEHGWTSIARQLDRVLRFTRTHGSPDQGH